MQKIAFIAPKRLQSAFRLLFDTAFDSEWMINATSVHALVDALQEKAPDVVIVYVSGQSEMRTQGWATVEQIGVIKQAWPNTCCIAVIETGSMGERSLSHGADLILIEGAPADKLVRTIEQRLRARSG